jgi:transposase
VKDILELKRQGLTVTQISTVTGFSRPTVRRYLQNPATPVYGPRVVQPSKLDPFKPYIEERLRAGVWNAVVLLRELKERGYDGSSTILREYIGPLRQSARVAAVRRFETPPGHQAQVDWGEIGDITTGAHKTTGTQRLKLSVFILTLGHSRAMFADAATDQTLGTLLRMHERAFEQLGGVPKEILYDRMKTVVLGMDGRGEIQWNPVFLDFSGHWGFTPRLCRAYRPQTKGKIESGVKYVKGNFLCGRQADGLEDLRRQLGDWVWGVANRRRHGTTGRIVLEDWAAERPHLLALGGRAPYPYVPQVTRRVSRDAYVSYGGNRYSVPWEAAGQEVCVQVAGERLQVLRGNRPLAEHRLCAGVHQTVAATAHHADIPLGGSWSGGKAKLHVQEGDAAPAVQVRSLSVYEALASQERSMQGRAMDDGSSDEGSDEGSDEESQGGMA